MTRSSTALILTTVLLCFLCGTTVRSQSSQVVYLKDTPDRLVHVYLGGGTALPVSNLADQTNSGYTGTLGVGIIPTFLSSGDIEIVLRGQYDRLSGASSTRPDISFMSVGLDWKLNLAPRRSTNWYLIAGGGFTRTAWHEFENNGRTIPQITESHLYGAGGMGIEFVRKSASPYIEARLANVTGPRMGNYYFFRIMAGLKI